MGHSSAAVDSSASGLLDIDYPKGATLIIQIGILLVLFIRLNFFKRSFVLQSRNNPCFSSTFSMLPGAGPNRRGACDLERGAALSKSSFNNQSSSLTLFTLGILSPVCCDEKPTNQQWMVTHDEWCSGQRRTRRC
jgi:hypothetical protein